MTITELETLAIIFLGSDVQCVPNIEMTGRFQGMIVTGKLMHAFGIAEVAITATSDACNAVIPSTRFSHSLNATSTTSNYLSPD
jgi:hypothetical protein